MRTAGASPPNRTARCTTKTETNTPYLFWEGEEQHRLRLLQGLLRRRSGHGGFSPRKLAEIGRHRASTTNLSCTGCRKCRITCTTLFLFQSEAYTDAAKLDIDPTPDSVLRVFMAWKPLHRAQTIEPQTFASFERNGFTVVEWGGCEVK